MLPTGIPHLHPHPYSKKLGARAGVEIELPTIRAFLSLDRGPPSYRASPLPHASAVEKLRLGDLQSGFGSGSLFSSVTTSPSSLFQILVGRLPPYCCPSCLPRSFRFTESLLLPLQMFLVCRDSSRKRLVLCVHFPSPKDNSTEVLEFPIKEEKSSKFSPHLPPPSTLQQQNLLATNAPLCSHV